MLNKYGKFLLCCVLFKELPLIGSIRTQIQEVKDPNVTRDMLKSKKKRKGNPNPGQGQLLHEYSY